MNEQETDTRGLSETEHRIIEAAKEVFILKGYESATMSDVAHKAGIGRTALHYYYRTKDILFDAVFEQLMASFLPNIDRILNESGTILQKLPVIIDCYMGVIRANPSFPNFVIGELHRDRNHIFQSLMKKPEAIQPILRLKQQIEKEMDEGILKKIPLIDLLTTIASLVVFPMLLKEPLCDLFLANDPDGFEQFLDRRKEFIIEVATRLLSPETH